MLQTCKVTDRVHKKKSLSLTGIFYPFYRKVTIATQLPCLPTEVNHRCQKPVSGMAPGQPSRATRKASTDTVRHKGFLHVM